MKPYYDDGKGIVIYHGRCEDVLPSLVAASVDLVFTSPPYNLGGSANSGLAGKSKRSMWRKPALAHGYGDHDDNLPWPVYVAWQKSLLTRLWECLTDDGAIYYNHKPVLRDGEARLPLDLNPGLPVRQVVIWDRGTRINFSPSHYVPTHEWIVILAKPGFRLASRSASTVGDVWHIAPETDTKHPAPFPLALPRRALATTSATTVLDPFLGRGTTLVAAKEAGRQGIGIEREERFCEMAARWLEETEPLPFVGTVEQPALEALANA